jgi:predicted RNase H-like nuclease (RuvC/YqgF family)
MADANTIAAYGTAAAGIITAIGGLLVGILGTRRAQAAAAQAASSAMQPVSAKMDEVGRQIGKHTYEVRDRMNTEALRGDTMQRNIETLVAAKSERPSEQSVWNYIRQAKAAQNEAQVAATQAQHALEQVQMLLGQTPTAKVTVHPVTGPTPPTIPPLKGGD